MSQNSANVYDFVDDLCEPARRDRLDSERSDHERLDDGSVDEELPDDGIPDDTHTIPDDISVPSDDSEFSDEDRDEIDIVPNSDLEDDWDSLSESAEPEEVVKKDKTGLYIPSTEPNWVADNFVSPEIPRFMRYTGPTLPMFFARQTSTPLEYFQLFFSDKVLERIVENTNNYVLWYQGIQRVLHPGYVDKKWTDISLSELKAYLGCLILMGLSPTKRVRHMWSKDEFLGNPFIKKTFTETRFLKISQYFHVSNRFKEPKRGTNDFDKLYKIRWLMNHLGRKFQEYQSPSKKCAIDEAMVPFKGECFTW
jgi:hypothetical protein